MGQLLSAALVFCALSVGPTPTPPDVKAADSVTTCFTHRKEFYIPVNVAEGYREKLTKMKLFVSSDQGRTWTLSGGIGPQGTRFTVRVPSDGEYWFTVQAVSIDGRESPADIAKSPPSLKVVVREGPPSPVP